MSWADQSIAVYEPSIIDHNDDLQCFHFDHCDIDSSDDVKQFRGMIKNKDGEIVCKTFDFTPEINQNDLTTILKYEDLILTSTCFLSYEATLLRIFNYMDKWYLTTCRKLDAFKSKWGNGKPFGDLFVDCIREIVSKDEHGIYKNSNPYAQKETLFQSWADETLDKSKVYCFLVRTYVENRIVCEGFDTPQIYCIGWFDKSNWNKFHYNDDTKVGPLVEEVLIENRSIFTIVDWLKNLDYKKVQGLIFINEQGKCFKLLLHEYDRLMKLRANQPSILTRYVELQQEGDVKRVEEFVNLYNEKRQMFIEFQDVIDDICKNIFQNYKNRFVRKQVSIAPPEQYYIIKELHSIFLSDRTKIVRPNVVQAYVHSLEPSKLMNLYKLYMKRKELYGHGNKIPDDLKDKVTTAIYQTPAVANTTQNFPPL